jgi:hypothetical protein
MSPSPFLCCLFVLAFAGGGECAASGRIGELQVRQGNGGVPCFTVAEAEELRGGAPDFHAITVSEVGAAPGAGARTTLWRMVMPPQRTFPVSFRMCIPYAGRLPVLPQTPAMPLRPGKIYEVAIEARPAPAGLRPAGAPRDYRARFCLVQAGGALRLRDLAAVAGRQRPMCGS